MDHFSYMYIGICARPPNPGTMKLFGAELQVVLPKMPRKLKTANAKH